jgi:hypothetical protein
MNYKKQITQIVEALKSFTTDTTYALSYPALKLSQSPQALVSISMSPVGDTNFKPEVDNITAFKALLQHFVDKNGTLFRYKLSTVEVITIFTEDTEITKWQICFILNDIGSIDSLASLLSQVIA